MAGLPSAYDCISMLHSSASGKQVLSRLEWALEDEAGQNAGLLLPSPAGWSAEKSLSQELGEPLRLPELGHRGSLQMQLCNVSASAGLLQKAGASLFARLSQFRSSLTGRWGCFFPVLSVPALGHDHGTAKALACSVPLRCGLVAPAGVSVSTSLGKGQLAQDTVTLVSCQTCAGICSRLHTTQKDILKAPTIFQYPSGPEF